MLSTMQDGPLLVSGILRHGQQVYGDSESSPSRARRARPRRPRSPRWPERSEQLAKALRRLGVGDGDRVGTFLWNNQDHLEAYLAVPSMGAVLHTLNLRLFPEQLAYVINHAEDKVDHRATPRIAPLLARVRDQCTTVRAHRGGRRGRHHRARARRSTTRRCWPPRSPATTGPSSTNVRPRPCVTPRAPPGNPKGVVYSHRSTCLHSFAVTSGAIRRGQRAGPRPRRSCPCSTPTPGACPTPPSWPGPT